ncbi:IPT/TIG domain-containing protein, partial [bacterium]|nr:IPT/TIG domain-containing protein [bacterium]
MFALRVEDVTFSNFTTNSEGSFVYHDPIEVEEISPRVSSCGGDLTVRLKNAISTNEIRKIFLKFGGAGGVSTPSVTSLCVVNEKELKCPIPTLEPGRHHVSISTNAQQYAPSPIAFVAHHTAHAYNVVPTRSFGSRNVSISIYFYSLSPRYGTEGTEVVVDAHGISGGHDYKCRFHGRTVPAVFNNSKLICVAPRVAKKGPVEFSISLDGIHFSVGGGCDSTFTYIETEVQENSVTITPRSSSSSGGDLVTISGLDLLSLAGNGRSDGSTRCRFGDIEMRALIDAGTNELKCLTPRVSQSGEKVLSVSFNGGVNYIHLGSFFLWKDPTSALLHSKSKFVIWPSSCTSVLKFEENFASGHLYLSFTLYNTHHIIIIIIINNNNNTGTATICSRDKVTVLGHLNVLSPKNDDSFKCHFGNQITNGKTMSKAAGGVMKCDLPRDPPSYAQAVPFGVSTTSSPKQIIWDEDAFRWESIAFPMSISPSVIDARGGAEIHIRGVNLTRTNKAWSVRFGSRTSRGIADIGRGAIVTMTPPMQPGIWPVQISTGDDIWVNVPGRLVVVDPVRVFLIQVEENTVELIYAAVGMHDQELLKNSTNSTENDLINAEALVEGYPNIPLQKKDDASGDWYARIHVYGKMDIVISSVRLTYANGTLPFLNSSSSKIPVHIENNPITLVDNNFGKGWHWRRQREQWDVAPNIALKGGELFNELGGVHVRFEGHSGFEKTTENATVLVTDKEISIRAKTPLIDNSYDGVTVVRVSLDQARFTSEDTTPQHIFDTRYELDTNVTTHLRISPSTSAFAGQSIAYNTVSRKRFDQRVVYDVAG